ncbi:MAG TPA: CocE/NonD family hydrolase C-terminal non-catalytic domain-containing protein [Terracidiphilus sp.]|nr:CocE/NonD family hydrolase C-terminal non-catalytic domain-containing protein [Terracidiphilus sp.]
MQEDVTIAGPISPRLKIASTGTDSDFDIKIIDVYPDNYPDPEDTSHGNKHILSGPPVHMGGYQELLRGEPFRAKFRDSMEHPTPLVPGKQTEIDFTMPDLFHSFRRGHRIMIQVQSSWFPLTDRNPQTFTDIPFAAPDQFQKATETVFHQQDAASGVEVYVLPQS